MKKTLLAAACTGMLLQTTSCINTEKEMGNARSSDRPFTPTPEGSRSRVNERTVLRTVTATHYFSNNKTKDNFILQLQGTKILSSQARLIIVSSTGDTLRNESMPATALLTERQMDDPRAATTRDKEIGILQGMNAFFREDQFVQPAVARNAVQPAEVDAQAWQVVKADTKAYGFDYTANGRERRLAYAKKLQKAVIVAE